MVCNGDVFVHVYCIVYPGLWILCARRTDNTYCGRSVSRAGMIRCCYFEVGLERPLRVIIILQCNIRISIFYVNTCTTRLYEASSLRPVALHQIRLVWITICVFFLSSSTSSSTLTHLLSSLVVVILLFRRRRRLWFVKTSVRDIYAQLI